MSPEVAELLANGWVTGSAIAAKVAVRTGEIHPDYDLARGYMLTQADDVTTPLCTVNGRMVSELAVLIKPVAFLVTSGNGTHEVPRCYFQDGKFTVGPDTKRIGGIGLKSVEYFPERGLYIHLEQGYELFAPSDHCQATWKH